MLGFFAGTEVPKPGNWRSTMLDGGIEPFLPPLSPSVPPFLPSVADQMMTTPMMMRLYAMRARSSHTQEQTLGFYLCEMTALDHFKWTWNIMTFAFLQCNGWTRNFSRTFLWHGFNFGRAHPHGEARGHLPLSLSPLLSSRPVPSSLPIYTFGVCPGQHCKKAPIRDRILKRFQGYL